MVSDMHSCSDVKDLSNEPWRLQVELSNVVEKLHSLSLKSYPVYIQSNQCSRFVMTKFHEMEDKAREVSCNLPVIGDLCGKISNESENIISEFENSRQTLLFYNKLMEFLEIPYLMDGCIRNEMFEEALQLFNYSNDVRENFGSSESRIIIDKILSEVTYLAGNLRERLLLKLCTDISLPECLRIMSLIREIDAATSENNMNEQDLYENKLKVDFLNCRDKFMLTLIKDLLSQDSFQYLVQMMETERSGWFDLLTKYSAIFGTEDDELISSWAIRKAVDFVGRIESHLKQINDFGSIASLLEQSVFFGGSLGRAGVDFSAPLSIIFESHILNMITTQWKDIILDFQQNLVSQVTSKGYSTPLMIGYSHKLDLVESTDGKNNDITPPKSLMSYPILAELTNEFLESFNDLRRCAIISLQASLTKRLRECLTAIVLSISHFCDEQNFNMEEIFLSMSNANTTRSLKVPIQVQMFYLTKCLAETLFPYLISCFRILYSEQALLYSELNEDLLKDLMISKNLYFTQREINDTRSVDSTVEEKETTGNLLNSSISESHNEPKNIE